MKAQRFEIGQAVTPKRGEGFSNWYGIPAPTQDIFHVHGYKHGSTFPLPVNAMKDDWYISLGPEDGNLWRWEPGFEPVELTSESISALMEQTISEPVTQ